MVDAHEGLVVLGSRLPFLELPSRTSLLSRRSVLQLATAAEAADAVLREARHDRAWLRRAGLELAGAQSKAAQPLGRRAAGHASHRRCRIVFWPILESARGAHPVRGK